MALHTKHPQWYSDADVAARLDDRILREELSAALVELSCGKVHQPLRSLLPLAALCDPDRQSQASAVGAPPGGAPPVGAPPGGPANGAPPEHGALFIKPVQWRQLVAVKLISLIPSNASRGLPGLLSVVVLIDALDGQTLAIMEGNVLTARRTAAATAIAADLFAKTGKCTLALIGSGVLARAHARALAQVRDLCCVRVWSPTPEHAHACATDVGGRAVGSAEEAVRDADIVCTVTHAQQPVLFGRWLKRGAFVAAVGAPRPTWRELDDEVMRHPIVVDQREAAMREAGDLILSGADIHAELGEVLAGTVAPPQPGETVVFKSLGLAVEDAVAASVVLRAPHPSVDNATPDAKLWPAAR